MKTLYNHTVLLTGATGGLGLATANALVTAGASIVLVGRQSAALENLRSNLTEPCPRPDSQQVHACVCDITRAGDRNELRAFIESLDRTVNVIINNAGVNDFSLLEDQQPEKIEQIFQVNALAPIHLLRELLPYLKSAGPVQVINIGSTFGSIGFPGYCAYAASKFALRGFSESLARELSGTPIKIRYFAPRATKTTLNSDAVMEMNRSLKVQMDDPEVVATALMRFILGRQRLKLLGWPERLFARINQLCPSLVSRDIGRQLPIIQKYARYR